MNDGQPSKEWLERFVQALAKRLPDYFKLHAQLIELADPVTRDLSSSFNELAERFNHNIYVLAVNLSCLKELGFIRFTNPHDFDRKVKIKILVEY